MNCISAPHISLQNIFFYQQETSFRFTNGIIMLVLNVF